MLNQVKNTAMLFVWALIAVLAIASIVRDCGAERVKTITVHDTLKLIPERVVITKQDIDPEYRVASRKIDPIHDTITLERIHEREQSRSELQRDSVHELLSLDTLIRLPFNWNGIAGSIPLFISDTCDCIGREIRSIVRLKDTTYTFSKNLVVPIPKNDYSLGVGFSYGATASGFLVPTLCISLTRTLISF